MKKLIYFISVFFLSSANAKVSPNYFFYVELKNNNCKWNLALPPELKPIEINSTKSINIDGLATCSKHIVFSKLEPKMFYINEDTIYSIEFKNGNPIKQKITKLPESLIKVENEGVFNINDKNNPIFAKMILIDEIKTEKASNGDVYIIYKNKKYLDPGYGTRMMIELYEYSSGKWVIIKTEITTTEAPDSKGMDVLQELKPKNYNSLSAKLQQSDAMFNNSTIKFNDSENKNNLKLMNKTLKNVDEEPFDPYKYISIDSKKGILSNIISGDYPHYALPIYLCENKCSLSNKLETYKFEASVGIHLNSDGYFIVGEENGNAHAQIFSVKETKPLKTFEKSIFATWLRQDYL